MFLTKKDEAILGGELGEGYRKAMELLVSLGDIKGADGFVDIKSAHVSGVSYLTIGDAGIELLEEWASTGAKVRVPTTTNPAGIDTEGWKEQGFPGGFAKKQKAILAAYAKMGVRTSCTCTPYLTDNIPKRGEHVAWAESNAVAYANSVLGALTNRESGISALAAALLGKVPRYGFHLDANRKPTLEVRLDVELNDAFDYSALGYHIGKSVKGIPLIADVKPDVEKLKALGAALATGGVSMFLTNGSEKTPKKSGKLEKLQVGKDELRDAKEMLCTTDGDVDIVCLGCPHCTVDEVRSVSKMKPRSETWVFTSRSNKPAIDKLKLHENIKMIYDTCMVVSPLKDIGIKSVGVNSAKAAFYSRNLSGLDVKFAPAKELVTK